MGKSLIITEKPSVAREFAQVLHVSGNQKGYIENPDYVITWCVGHLVGLVYPEDYDMKYKKWRLEDLPFLPEKYKYDVIKNVKDQYDTVHRMLQRKDIDRVYWAGDAGKEGQTIEENIRNFGGVRPGMEELRVWIDSQTEEEILRGIREAKPMSEYANLGNSGIMRTIEDYAMGINFSRVLSVKYGSLLNDAAGTRSYIAIAVGRVMTCVLGMVVEREREIRNFKETPFYRVIGSFSDAQIEGEWKAVEGSHYFQSPKLYKENGFKEEADAKHLIDELNGKKAVIESIEKSISRKKAPLLFNLAELQAECSKRFKISPDEALQAAQDLYEKKLTTYPRTDARVLSSAVAKVISKNIGGLKKYEPCAEFAENILSKGMYKNIAKTQYTDDSKVTDHYAIIPTGQLNELGSLNNLQRSVYDMIVRRFLSIFYPPAEYENVKLVVNIDTEQDKKEKFFSSSRVLKKPGYLEIAGIPKNPSANASENKMNGSGEKTGQDDNSSDESISANPSALMELAKTAKKGDEISVIGYDIRCGKTSPPKRYTSGSMVLAMENAGQLIEDEELREQIKGSGIGTSATRAEIIAKLVRIHYLNLNKKTQILTPENLGEMVYEVVHMTVPALLNPKMTASWEKGLDGITRGTVEFRVYRQKLEDYIRRETLKMIEQELKTPIQKQIAEFCGQDAKGIKKPIGVICPLCGKGQVVTTPFGYGCSEYKTDKTGCNFTIGELCGQKPEEEQARKLITEGHTDLIRGFRSKAGKRFDAALKLEKSEDGKLRISFDFTDRPTEVIEDLKCPLCGGRIAKTTFGYACENHRQEDNSSCAFSVGQIAGKSLTVKDMTDLIQNGRTETLRGFKSKAGKRFDACLALKKNEEGKTVIAFDFENTQDDLLSDVKCPDCGGQIKRTAFGFGCLNYRKDDPSSCRFSIGQIAGKKLTDANIRQLLTEGHTDTIRGFKAKSGKRFDSCLKLVKNEDGKSVIQFDFENVTDLIIKDVKCPICGGKIKKTQFGWGCENYEKDKEGSCRFSIGTMGGKTLTEAQVKQLLTDGRTETIYGFKSKAGKKFDGRIALNKDENGKITGLKYDFDQVQNKVLKDVKCPKCGGKIEITKFGFYCENYTRNSRENAKDQEAEPQPLPKESSVKTCDFHVGMIASVKLNQKQVTELLTKGKTGVIEGFVAKTGMKFDAPLKLDKDKKIVFDFPEKAKPVESSIVCPKCGQKMMRGQWQYECTCGNKFWHTIGKVPLSEETISNLITTGKTKEKITGLTSKAGNVFDAYLKFEDGQIRFDFERHDDEGSGAGGVSAAGTLLTGTSTNGSRSKSGRNRESQAVDFSSIDDVMKEIEALQEDEGLEPVEETRQEGSDKNNFRESPSVEIKGDELEFRGFPSDKEESNVSSAENQTEHGDDYFLMYAGQADEEEDLPSDDLFAMAHEMDERYNQN